jgi:hypothetical protein
MRLTQKSWWLAVLVGGLASTSVVMVRAAPPPAVCQPASVCPPGYFISVSYSTSSPPPASGEILAVIALCPSPSLVLGGGFYSDWVPNLTVINSFPLTNYDGPSVNNGWRVEFQSNGGDGFAYAYAICLDPSILSTMQPGRPRQ